MHNEFTAIVERDEKWFIAYCPEIAGANGQGKTKAECLKNLSEAIDLILEDRRAEPNAAGYRREAASQPECWCSVIEMRNWNSRRKSCLGTERSSSGS